MSASGAGMGMSEWIGDPSTSSLHPSFVHEWQPIQQYSKKFIARFYLNKTFKDLYVYLVNDSFL